jgi:hypothetical protein
MKNRFAFAACFLIVVCLTDTLPAKAQNTGHYPYPYPYHIQSKKNNKEKIDLVNRCERSLGIPFPKILLFKQAGYLEATILSCDSDMKVRITGDGDLILFESTIHKLQKEWQLDIDFLQPDKRYKIMFISPSGGYVFGYFLK